MKKAFYYHLFYLLITAIRSLCHQCISQDLRITVIPVPGNWYFTMNLMAAH